MTLEIKRLAVVGGGQMGRGIAQVAASCGIDVHIKDASFALAQSAVDTIGASLERLVRKEKLSAEERSAIVGRIHPATSFEDLAEANLVVEAAPEVEEMKVELFRELDEVLSAEAIFASNTSSISITKLASETRRPERFIGMHFMNPVPVMKLVEVIRGLETTDECYEATLALAARMGKTTVTSRDVPGFIVNRILIPLLNEACYALYEGIGSAEDIDTGIRLGLNHPMGPLALADLIGLDTCLFIAEVLHRELGDDKYRPCPLLRQYVAARWLGRKTGRGFYRYDRK